MIKTSRNVFKFTSRLWEAVWPPVDKLGKAAVQLLFLCQFWLRVCWTICLNCLWCFYLKSSAQDKTHKSITCGAVHHHEDQDRGFYNQKTSSHQRTEWWNQVTDERREMSDRSERRKCQEEQDMREKWEKHPGEGKSSFSRNLQGLNDVGYSALSHPQCNRVIFCQLNCLIFVCDDWLDQM